MIRNRELNGWQADWNERGVSSKREMVEAVDSRQRDVIYLVGGVGFNKKLDCAQG